MIDFAENSEYRSTRSIYENYISGNGGMNLEQNSRLESKSAFREERSQYRMENQMLAPGTDGKYNNGNCGGIPLDYDPEHKTVYVDGSDAHSLLIGATGSKKSRLVVMPMVRILASAGEDMIICDPKGEIYQRVSSFLEENEYQTYVINLREPGKGDGWNILKVPYQLYCAGNMDKACAFINDITINLIPVSAEDPYWDHSARDMLFGLILLLFKLCKEGHQSQELVNMQSVLRLREELFSSRETSVIQQKALWHLARQDALIRARLNGTVISPEKTLSCIVSTFDQHMSCFSLQPEMADMLSRTTFDLEDMGIQKVALFLIIPDEKLTYHKIVSIFLKQIYELLIDRAYVNFPDNRYPVRINFVLDEFSSLPRIQDFPQMISASRSRNIRFSLILQSKHQLRQRYGEETETIMSNCSNWLYLTSRETDLLQELSILSGTTGQNAAPLLSISKLQHLNQERGECLVFCGRKFPYIGRLPDISEYDHEEFAPVEMKIRSKPANNQHLCEAFFAFLAEEIVKMETEEKSKEVTSTDIHDHKMSEEDEWFERLFGNPQKSDVSEDDGGLFSSPDSTEGHPDKPGKADDLDSSD